MKVKMLQSKRWFVYVCFNYKMTGVNSEDKIRFIQRFADEAKIMKQMKHERIVEFINLDLDSLSIIMELMPVGSLSSYIQRNRANSAQKTEEKMLWSVRTRIMTDICEGVEYLHSPMKPGIFFTFLLRLDGSKKLELFHQDIKSSNVLLKIEDGQVRAKISDFGLSCNIFESND
jgi:serine/threonine protein kinase